MSTALRISSIRSAVFPKATSSRLFSSSAVVQASKAHQAASKAAQRAKKGKASADASSEIMNVSDAAAILRAVDVANPNAAYEITITTKFIRGQAAPRGRISLPRDARAKAETVLVFASGKSLAAAKAAGAHYAGGEELFEDILTSKIVPTKVICTPIVLPAVQQKLARFLGPKGLMPAEKRGTVTTNVAAAVKQAQGTMNWKGDRLGVIRAPVARINWPLDDVVNNVKAFVQAVKQGTGPHDAAESLLGQKKVSSVLQIFLSSRQGPGIRLADV